MGSLNDKLDATASSKEAIKNAISSKGGTIDDSTPLSQYDDIINSFEILDENTKNYINNYISNSGDSYLEKLQDCFNTSSEYLNDTETKITGSNILIQPTGTQLPRIVSAFKSNLQNNWTNILTTLEKVLPDLGDLIVDPNNDFKTMTELKTLLNDYTPNSDSDVMVTYLNFTGNTMYVCMPNSTMQSCSSATGSSTAGHMIETVRGLAAGSTSSWSYDYSPVTALWGGSDSENYGSYKGFYIYRNPSNSLSVFTDYDGTSTRTLYGLCCGYTSTCMLGDM